MLPLSFRMSCLWQASSAKPDPAQLRAGTSQFWPVQEKVIPVLSRHQRGAQTVVLRLHQLGGVRVEGSLDIALCILAMQLGHGRLAAAEHMAIMVQCVRLLWPM